MASAPPQIAGTPPQSGWKDYLTLVLSATTALAGIFYLLGAMYFGSLYGTYQPLLINITASAQIVLTGALVFFMTSVVLICVGTILLYIKPLRRLLQGFLRHQLLFEAGDLAGLDPSGRAIVGALDVAMKLVLAFIGFVGVSLGIIAFLLWYRDADVAQCADCVVITTKSGRVAAEIIGKDGSSLFVEDGSAAIRMIKLDDVQFITRADAAHRARGKPTGVGKPG